MKKKFWTSPSEHGKSEDLVELWTEPGEVSAQPPKGSKQTKAIPFLLLGFDTEFKTPEEAVTAADIESGLARSRILSYQFHAKLPDGTVWQGICCPEGDQRLTLTDFMLFVMGCGTRLHGLTHIPSKIYLVGHFTRADIPAFADFAEINSLFSAVRNTFVSIDNYLSIDLPLADGTFIQLRIYIRDTMLLTPQSSKSLKKLGELVGVQKLELSPDRQENRRIMKNMDRVRSEQWDLFKRYALTDAEICVKYIEKVMEEYQSVTGNVKVPITLTGIGIDLLERKWQEAGINRLAALGKESVVEAYYNKTKQRFVKKKVEVDLREVRHNVLFVTDCYHGGRNEQFWFGPGFEDDWSDFDLSSAYPTAMSLIGMPDWTGNYSSRKVNDYTPETLGFAYVEFEFPEGTKYPTMPVRTPNGLVFPLKGVTDCAAPEIYLANQLGAKLTIKHGIIVPTNLDIRVFEGFIRECGEKRVSKGKNTLQGLFWKEISNSTYGKTAQGLRDRRVYDLRDRATKSLPASRITNAYFAASITSYVRAVLGEIMNAIPDNRTVFSCTTDGFLSNMTDAEALVATSGVLCSLYRRQRKALAGVEEVLEKKHQIRTPLGWRTRGQATLVPGKLVESKDTHHILLAKGGIWLRPELKEAEEQNDAITDKFFNRHYASYIRIEGKTSLRDMVEFGADLVEKLVDKRLNMEYDWKRRPIAAKFSEKYSHIAFSTEPWATVEQFNLMRATFEDRQRNAPSCIKTMDDFLQLSIFVETKTIAASKQLTYISKIDGDTKRLRQVLCSAFKHRVAGFGRYAMTNEQFSAALINFGIKCSKADVENGLKRQFLPHQVPPTERVLKLLHNLKQDNFKALDIELLLVKVDKSSLMIRLKSEQGCQFVDRVE